MLHRRLGKINKTKIETSQKEDGYKTLSQRLHERRHFE